MLSIKPFLWAVGACSLLVLPGCGGGLDPNPGGTTTTLSNRLSGNDFYDNDSDRYYDIYVADALESGSARVAMRSGDFDTQLYVYEKDSDGTYDLIEEDDDGGSNTDSDLNFSITRGRTYRILATSSSTNEQGYYEIRFSDELSKPAQVTTQDMRLASVKKFALPARAKK